MDKEHILNEIQRLAEANDGIPLGKDRFFNESGIREVDWKGKYWVNWSDAIKEAGYQPQEFNNAIDSEILLEKAAALIRELGHFPQRAELNLKRRNDPTFPSEKTFRRFGTKATFAKAVYDWSISKENWKDVAALCEDIKADVIEEIDNFDSNETEVDGFVYLMKSGKYYKIGRTNSLDRRQYEIGMQLPEGIEPIHSIKTDDPSGIEAYWHNRFKEKRMNGEWFNLSIQDVAAFRKRKFM